MRLGIFLLALAGCCSYAAASSCIVGNLVVQDNVITSKSIENKECEGICRRQTLSLAANQLVLFTCEDSKMEAFLNQGQSCSSSELETSCYCSGHECSKIDLKEEIPTPVENLAVANNILCYVGFESSGAGSLNFLQGDVVTCSTGNVCANVTATYQGVTAALYACMPQQVCKTIFPNSQQTVVDCGTLSGTPVQGCCCYEQDCRKLAPYPNLPTPQPFGNNNVSCYQGVSVNGATIAGGSFAQCGGECGSARVRTTLNGANVWAEVFACDPVNIFTALNVDNDCRTIDSTNINNVPTGIITACACNTDKCLDPTVVPPVYPVRQLKCAVGLYNGTQWLGAEMNCNGRCGRFKFNINGSPMAYYTCAPYDVCAGFGLESSEGITYNPPQDQELEAYCCSARNNCNVDKPEIAVQVNNSAVSTANYPILCYGGIWVNGVPITNSAYGLCQGECASASFQTKFAGQTHNTTFYTCDPVTMCSQAGIRNGCNQISTGVTACCCDNDLCIDPNRGSAGPNLRCYSGISIPQDGYNQGGDQICDGWCGSLNSNVNGKNATVYFCSPVFMCRYFGLGFGGNGNCAAIQGADPPVTGCCCSDSDNCLAPVGVNVTAIAARKDPKIVCYEGLHINGNNITFPFYRICDGECVSVQMGGTINGNTHYAQLFTCDPSSACAAMGIRNNCSLVDNSVTACCCDSDECIDPTVNRWPGNQLKCYVGILSKFSNISTGAEIICNGQCASVSAVVGSDYVTAFHCAPRSICRSLGVDNSNNTLYLDRAITVSCCDSADNCNLAGTKINATNLPVAPNEAPKACYEGVFIGGKAVSSGGWKACQGDCVSIALNTTYNNAPTIGTLYTCDPSVVCRNLKIQNICHKLEDGLEACCCDTDACLDPTVTPPRKPFGEGNLCYVGVYSYSATNKSIVNVGGEEYCQGSCGAIQGSIGGANVTAYACVPNYVCTYLGLYNDCQSVWYDRAITGCCCTSGPNCNRQQVQPTPPPVPRRRRGREFPITCPAGLFIDNLPVTPVQFQVCDGDCASITINGTVGSALHVATLYSCDPSSVCTQLGLYNNCGSPETGLTGCCCNTDACLDPMRNKTVPTPPLKCYVGLYSNKVQTGAEILCDGKCASVNANLGTDNMTLFACVPHKLCRSLELYDTCTSMAPYYPEFNACCCDNKDNCNVDQTHLSGKINTTIPLSPLNDYPISCYAGLFINGTAFSDGGWTTCQGECVSVSLTSQFRGTSGTATLYTCDPSRVCRNLGLVNNCQTLENGVTGCCCNTDGCVDPTKNPPRTPGNPLYCYAGIKSNYALNGGAPLNVGAEILCNGKCSRLSGKVNGYHVDSYHCSPTSICRALEYYDNCDHPKVIHEDRQIRGCCCDNFNNCNANNTGDIVIPAPLPTVDLAIACYSALYVNGSAITPVVLNACQGQCASITINTQLNGVDTAATLYGCDPTTVCQALNMSNACASPEPGLTGCCCDTDLCLDPPKNKTVPTGSRLCYAGIYALGNATGSEIVCNGKCAAVSAKVNGDPVTVFGCAPAKQCRQMELYDNCKTVTVDRDVTGCCCDNYDNCNVDLAGLGTKVNTSIPIENTRPFPISCYSGLFINDVVYADGGWQVCKGECASATITTTLNNKPTNATLYTCDPVSTCFKLGLGNNCADIEPGLNACCCSDNACLDPTVSPPKKPKVLKCYVGIRSTYQNLNVGAESVCFGQCASLTGIVANQNVTVYNCVPDLVCKTLLITDQCVPLYGDRSVSACCCNNADNCNVKDPSIVPGPVVPPFNDYPIACFNGITLNGTGLTPLALEPCFGQCASVSITTQLSGVAQTATLYSCDPTTVCQQLNMTNSCASPEPGVTGCCCDSDACINPYTGVVPGPLNCYVGIYTSDKKVNAGATAPCDGYCGSLETTFNNVFYKSYHCVPKQICHNLELNNKKRTITGDTAITAYCCSTGSNCHVTEAAVNASVIAPMPTTNPIACRSSVYLNGAPITQDGFAACYGQCATVSYNGNVGGANNTLTLFTCDPSTVCDALSLSDSCAFLDSGLSGCCCNTDNCVGPNIQPTPPTGATTSNYFSVFTTVAAVYIALTRF